MRRPASRSSCQSGRSATTAARRARIVVVALCRLRRSWALRSAARAASGNGGARACGPVATSALLGGEDLGDVHRPDAAALAGKTAADVQQARVVGGADDLGAGVENCAHLVGEHGGGRVG